MKKIYVFLAVMFTAVGIAFATSTIPVDAVPSSFRSTVINRVNSMIAEIDVLEALPAAQSYTGEALVGVRMARVEYDVTGGDSGGVGAHGLGVTIPANSIITRSFLYITTQFVDAGSGTVALHCQTANNILTAQDITGSASGVIAEGGSTGASAAMKALTAACEVTATVGTAAQTAGKLVGFIEYVTHD